MHQVQVSDLGNTTEVKGEKNAVFNINHSNKCDETKTKDFRLYQTGMFVVDVCTFLSSGLDRDAAFWLKKVPEHCGKMNLGGKWQVKFNGSYYYELTAYCPQKQNKTNWPMLWL